MSDANLDASILTVERALIGAVIYEGGRIIPPLLPAEFYSDRHRQIWEALVDLAEGVDVVTVYRELATRGQADAVGGPAYLAQCLEDGTLVIRALMPRYAALVRDAARVRMLRQLGRDLAEQGFGEHEIERRLAEVPGALVPVEDRAPTEVWREHEARVKDSGVSVKTNIHALDEILGAFVPGEIAIVAGRTSHGKSSFMLHVALEAAKAGVPVTFLTLEEPLELVTVRAVSNKSGVPYMQLAQSGTCSEEERREIEVALRWLDETPLTFVSLETLRSLDEETVCGAVAAAKTPVVMVDHLQKIGTGSRDRQYGLEGVMNRLHAAALRDHRIIVVAAQLGREMDKERRAPRLSDLRDSGSIEILARKVLLLYWPSKHDASKDSNEYRIEVAKHATGKTGHVTVRFGAATGAFWDATP